MNPAAQEVLVSRQNEGSQFRRQTPASRTKTKPTHTEAQKRSQRNQRSSRVNRPNYRVEAKSTVVAATDQRHLPEEETESTVLILESKLRSQPACTLVSTDLFVRHQPLNRSSDRLQENNFGVAAGILKYPIVSH
ncbi:unnamed protein product [Linum trigynum]|uniref:Uncharacterized protein n=1 Tax=Linum trigynum TaxID=586398 RepID=A0AAV2FEF7_9ROSI